MRFVSAFAFASQLFAVLAAPTCQNQTSSKVLYVQDNNPAGNSIVAARISDVDGTLTKGVRTSTGGKGLELVIAASQDSVIVYGQYLFTTNAGDNTLSMFIIDPLDPLRPRLVGNPAPTLGLIPISVAYSPRLEQACAANGGGEVATVTCFTVDPVRGLRVSGPPREIPIPFNLPPLVPFIPSIITRDIAFNPSSTALFVATFYSLTTPGYVYAYPVVNGMISHEPVINEYPGEILPFSINFLGSDSKMFLTNVLNPMPGSANLEVSPSFETTPTTINTFSNSNVSAPCWGAYAPTYDVIFATDFTINNITIVNTTTGVTIMAPKFETPTLGALDEVVEGDYLYFLTVPMIPGNFSAYVASPQVLVWDIRPLKSGEAPKQVQSFDLFNAFGSDMYELQGMAVYPFIPANH